MHSFMHWKEIIDYGNSIFHYCMCVCLWFKRRSEKIEHRLFKNRWWKIVLFDVTRMFAVVWTKLFCYFSLPQRFHTKEIKTFETESSFFFTESDVQGVCYLLKRFVTLLYKKNKYRLASLLLRLPKFFFAIVCIKNNNSSFFLLLFFAAKIVESWGAISGAFKSFRDFDKITFLCQHCLKWSTKLFPGKNCQNNNHKWL